MCGCVPCSCCGGDGYCWFGIDGECLGEHHIDDLDSLEPCPFCNGSGYEFECHECSEDYEEY